MKTSQPRLFLKWLSSFESIALALALFVTFKALAAEQSLPPTIITDGQNVSSSMGSVATMATTIHYIAYNWVAPILGTGLAIFGIYKIAVRESLVGTIALVCGGAMFFVEKIVTGLRSFTGGG